MGMEISSDLFDGNDSIFEFAESIGLELPPWEGREVTLEKLSAYTDDLVERIENQFQLLAIDEKAFFQAAIYLARIGARSPEERALLERDIQHLVEESSGTYIVKAGSGKKAKHWWNKHKKVLIIGAVAAGIIVGIGLVAFCTGGTGTQIAGTLGAAALDALCNGENNKKDTRPTTNYTPQQVVASASPDTTPQNQIQNSFPEVGLPFLLPESSLALSESPSFSSKSDLNSLLSGLPAPTPHFDQPTLFVPDYELTAAAPAQPSLYDFLDSKSIELPLPTYPQGLPFETLGALRWNNPFANSNNTPPTSSAGPASVDHAMPSPPPTPLLDLQEGFLDSLILGRRKEEEDAWVKELAERKAQNVPASSDSLELLDALRLQRKPGEILPEDDILKFIQKRSLAREQATEAFFKELNPFVVPEDPNHPLNPGELAEANERRRRAYEEVIDALLTGREIEGSSRVKPVDNYASAAYYGSVFIDTNSQPPFQEIQLHGHPYQSTVHFHCGINNSPSSTFEGGGCLYKTLDKEFAVQPHLVHSPNIVTGLTMVGLEKLDTLGKSPAVAGLPLQLAVPGLAVPEFILQHSHIQKSIDYETEHLTKIAEKIIEKNQPNLKQLHVTFSNGGYVFGEALKRLPPEYQDTILVITAGTTAIVDDNLACKVYNVIGDKDWPSRVCNGGLSHIESAKERATIELISQSETDGVLGGHYFVQPEYQREISKIVSEKIIGQYEIY